jgi:MEMO1 family protein
MTTDSSLIRRPAVAGSFYEKDPAKLRRQVQDLLDRAEHPALMGALRGLIAPHAGYMYSGLAAASAYHAAKGDSYDTVVLVGPSHRDLFDGIAAFPGNAYRTPLGDVQVDTEMRDALCSANGRIAASEWGHRAEHCLEVQLPFLQLVLDDFSILPLIIGNQTMQDCLSLGEALGVLAKERRVLLVASSDLSHYHPYDEAIKLDDELVRFVLQMDERRLMEQLEREKLEACGGGPIVAVMHAAKLLGANKSQVLTYYNSGDITGDRSAVVGYLSAALVQAR